MGRSRNRSSTASQESSKGCKGCKPKKRRSPSPSPSGSRSSYYSTEDEEDLAGRSPRAVVERLWTFQQGCCAVTGLPLCMPAAPAPQECPCAEPATEAPTAAQPQPQPQPDPAATMYVATTVVMDEKHYLVCGFVAALCDVSCHSWTRFARLQKLLAEPLGCLGDLSGDDLSDDDLSDDE